MKPGKSYSIKDVAKLANVSIGTVDRVLHDRKGVSQKTRARVLAIIKETGYKKNIMASRLKLASNHTINIAVLLPEIKEDWSYWKWPQLGITRAVNEFLESGVNIEYFYFDVQSENSFRQKCGEILSGSFSAIVTVPFMEEACNDLLKSAKIPVVFLDTHQDLLFKGNFINQDSYEAGRVAARLLHYLVGDDGAYLIINMVENGEVRINCRQREEGFHSFFAKNYPDKPFEIHSYNHAFGGKKSLTENLLPLLIEKDIKGVFITNSRAFMIAKILEQFPKMKIFLLGFDLNYKNVDLLKQQKIHFLINQKPDYQGYMTIKGLYKYLTERDPSGLNAKIPVEIIVKENIPVLTTD